MPALQTRKWCKSAGWDSQHSHEKTRMFNVVEEAYPEEYTAESGLDVHAEASPNCPICKGNGEIPQTREDGYSVPEVCDCVTRNIRKRSAERMALQRFPGPLRAKTFAKYDDGGNASNRQIADALMRFVDKLDLAMQEGWIVGLYGPPSAGKTHLAIATAIMAIKRWLADAILVRITDLMELPDKAAGDLLQRAIDADLLILDDLGYEYEARVRANQYDTNWQDQRLYRLLDGRISAGRPILYTTNLTPSALEAKLSDRVMARIKRNEVAAFELAAVERKNTPNKRRLDLLLGKEDETAPQEQQADTTTQRVKSPLVVASASKGIARFKSTAEGALTVLNAVQGSTPLALPAETTLDTGDVLEIKIPQRAGDPVDAWKDKGLTVEVKLGGQHLRIVYTILSARATGKAVVIDGGEQ